MRVTVRYGSGRTETVSSVHESRGGVLLLHDGGIAYFRRHEVASLEVTPGGGGGRSTELIEAAPYLTRGRHTTIVLGRSSCGAAAAGVGDR